MKLKRIVITGGPGTGKTSVIQSLQKKGFLCYEEISREIIKEYQSKGVANPFESHAKEFSDRLFWERIQQFKSAETAASSPCFYDRGILDVIAYLNYATQEIPQDYIEKATSQQYTSVFILRPWEAIYTKDTERFESFDEAKKIHAALLKTYNIYGYTPIEVPFETIANRVSFIIKNSL